MMFPGGQTVSVVTRTRAGEDQDGNDQFTLTSQSVSNVPVWPRTSVELVQGQDLVTTGLTALMPPCVDVSAIDKVVVYGETYEVDGDPRRYASPFTGLNPGVEIDLKKVTG